MVFVVCLVAYSWGSANFCCGYYANSLVRFFNTGCYRKSESLSCSYGSDRLVFKPILKMLLGSKVIPFIVSPTTEVDNINDFKYLEYQVRKNPKILSKIFKS